MTVALLKIQVSGQVAAYRELPLGTYQVGRGFGELPLEDPNVSGLHARIDVSPGAVTITDLGSANGTFDASGNRLGGTYHLVPGQPVRLGQTWLELARPMSGATTAMPAYVAPPATSLHALAPSVEPPIDRPRAEASPQTQGTHPASGFFPGPKAVDPFEDPRAPAGSRLILLGGATAILGLVLLVLARAEVVGSAGGYVVGTTLLVAGLGQLGTGMLWRSRLSLLVNQPRDLTGRGGTYGYQHVIELMTNQALPVGSPEGFLGRFLYNRFENLGWAPAPVQLLAELLVESTFATALYVVAGGIALVGAPERGAVLTFDRVLWMVFFAVGATWSLLPIRAMRPKKARSPMAWAKRTALPIVAAIVLPPVLEKVLHVGTGNEEGATYPAVWLLFELALVAVLAGLSARQVRDQLHFKVSTAVSRGNAQFDAQVMPQQVYETLMHIMAAQRDARPQPNRVYFATPPAAAAQGIAGHSDMRGNFEMAILQETQPVLAGPPEPLSPSGMHALNAGIGLLGAGTLWIFGSAVFGSFDSVLSALLTVVPPTVLYLAGTTLLGVVIVNCSRVAFLSTLMCFQVRGTFEATYSREVSTHLAPWVQAARVLTYTYLNPLSSQPSALRHLASMTEAPDVVSALTHGLEESLGAQVLRKAAQLSVKDNLAQAMGRHAAQQVSVEQLMPHMPPGIRRLSR